MLSKSTVKYIQSLQHKKFRDQEAVFVAEGPKLVKELLDANLFTCVAIYAMDGWQQTGGSTLPVEPVPVKDYELEKISSLSKPNQVLAIFMQKKANSQPDIRNKITLVLDDIQDPGNLGTIIRTADWFDVQHIICSMQTADMYNSKVVQSTMASLGRVEMLYTNIEYWLAEHPSIPVLAATLEGESLTRISLPSEAIIVIGNESKGVSDAILKKSTQQITIPRIGQAESLNAAVATALVLYEFKRK